MFKTEWNPIIIIFIGIAIFGFFFELITNTRNFLISILVMSIVIVIFIGIYRYLLKNTLAQHSKRSMPYNSGPYAFSQKNSFSPRPTIKTKAKSEKKSKSNVPFKVIKGGKK